MLCPACASRAIVIDTRHPRRRYLCRSCDIRWSTLETIAPHTLRPSRPAPARKPKPKDGRTWIQRIQATLAE